MQPIFYVLLAAFFAYFAIGLAVFVRNWDSLINRMFFSLCANLSLWAFGYAVMVHAPDIGSANVWRVVASLGICLFFGTCLEFALLIRNESRKWMTDIRRLMIYLPGVFFFINSIGYIPGQVLSKYNGMWLVRYPLDIGYLLFIVYYASLSAAGITILYRWGKHSRLQREKKQSFVIVATSVVPLIIGMITDTILPACGFKVFPYAIIAFLVPCAGMLYVIAKYNMMVLSPQVAYEYIFRTMNDPVILFGNDMLVKDINCAAVKATDFSGEELKGMSFEALLDCKPGFERIKEDISLHGSVKNAEVGLNTRDYRSIPCMLSGSRLLNRFNESLGFVCVLHDFSDRKNWEKHLERTCMALEFQVLEKDRELCEMARRLDDERLARLKTEESLRLGTGRDRPTELNIKSKHNIYTFDFKDIVYIEKFGHQMVIHTTVGEVESTESLENLEAVLDGSLFFRCHKSYIVNLSFITNVDYSENKIYLKNGETCIFSKRNRKLLKEKILSKII